MRRKPLKVLLIIFILKNLQKKFKIEKKKHIFNINSYTKQSSSKFLVYKKNKNNVKIYKRPLKINKIF
jgi:hypothetical protein